MNVRSQGRPPMKNKIAMGLLALAVAGGTAFAVGEARLTGKITDAVTKAPISNPKAGALTPAGAAAPAAGAPAAAAKADPAVDAYNSGAGLYNDGKKAEAA